MYATYILTNKKNGTLYVGVTGNLKMRIYEHKKKLVEGFSKKYSLDRLVWFQAYESVEYAITKEKQLKEWKRVWKIELIEEKNPNWDDLYAEL